MRKKHAVLVLVGAGSIFLAWIMSCNAESNATKAVLSKLKATEGAYTFAVIGDNRSGDNVYKLTISQMMRRDPLFVMNTGDLIPTPGNREEWANFWRLSRAITVPYFPAPGNHDIDDEKSQDVWRDEVDLPGAETYYSFEVGRDLFVVLNSCEPENDRRIAGKQLEWLKSVLKKGKYKHTFVFLHHPLFVTKGGKYYGEGLDRYPIERDELHSIFVAGGVNAVFEGHVHTYKRINVDGIEYVITGGGGAPLYGKESYNHVMVLRVDGPRVEAKIIDRDGFLRDEFVLKEPLKN